MFDKAQEKESVLWRTVISFDNRFLEEYGLYSEETKNLDSEKIKKYCQKAISKCLIMKI